MASLRNDLKTAWNVWKKISDIRLSVVQMILFVFISIMAVLFVKPNYIERITEIAGSWASILLGGILMLHLLITAAIIITKNPWEKDKYFFYQLTIARKPAFIVVFLENIGWYYYFMVFLLVITNIHNKFLPGIFVGGTAFYILCFSIHYHIEHKENADKKKIVLNHFSATGYRNSDFFRNHPNIELIVATLRGYYTCKGLVFSKSCFIIILIFMGVFSSAHRVDTRAFLLFNIFLILLNDGYWKQESRNFLYFSRLGIPIEKYLSTQIVSGSLFNMGLSILVLVLFKTSLISIVLCIFLLLYVVSFWCLVQVYLWLAIDQGRDQTVTLWSILFLIAGLIPAANIFIMFWLFNRVKRKWLEA